MYGTSDHRAILVCPVERHFWERFCDLAKLPEKWKSVGDWSVSGMYNGSGPEQVEERKQIQARIGERSLADWTALLTDAEIPFAPVLTIAEALTSEHAAANGIVRTESFAGHKVSIPSIPVRVVSQPGEGLSGVSYRAHRALEGIQPTWSRNGVCPIRVVR
jgi:crotonobetainyl-CoA:carnitine CoA-transferase CaiB-like acyl-CoA transferase